MNHSDGPEADLENEKSKRQTISSKFLAKKKAELVFICSTVQVFLEPNPLIKELKLFKIK